jgi:CRP/FNR family transcriptional regulator, anaerobic regulatory protein
MHTAARSATVAPIVFVPASPTDGSLPTPRCSGCHLRDLCLPGGLGGIDVQRLDQLGFARRRVREGEPLYHEGEKFEFLYAVRSGTFKSVVSSREGREQVTSFHMAGEMMGLDGLAEGRHASGSRALEDAEVCAVPYAQLERLAASNRELQQAVSRLLSREIVREHSLMMLLGSMSSEERLAAFLLNVSHRMQARGYSGSEFHLRMSRAEIGSYLGMTLETVSRTFSAFQQQQRLQVDKKHVRILDLGGFQRAFEATLQ